MNYRLLSRVFGTLLILISVGMFACTAFAFVEQIRGVEKHATSEFTLSASITAAAGIFLFLGGLGSGYQILRKEAVVVVGLGWFVSAVFGALPYILTEPSLSFPQAFFESTSGFTTTGSTVIANLGEYPRALLLWRSVTQWLGGVGILVLFVALLAYLGSGGKSLFRVESSAGAGEGTGARIRHTATRLWLIYLMLSVITLTGLKLLGLSWFDAVCHSMTTVATGGFSTYDASIAAFESARVEIFLSVMMLASGVTFFFYAALIQKNWKRVRSEEEAKWYICIALVAMALITITLWFNSNIYKTFDEALVAAIFQTSAILTTTGFASENYNAWPGPAIAVLIALMIMGGCSGSTAGGPKIARLLLFLKAARQEVVSSFRPRRLIRIELNGRPAEASARSAVFLLVLFGSCTILGTLGIAFMEPARDFDTCFSASLATLFNIGPGIHGIGPTENFSGFGSPSLLFMSLLMIMGRLELFAVLALFIPSLWRKY